MEDRYVLVKTSTVVSERLCTMERQRAAGTGHLETSLSTKINTRRNPAGTIEGEAKTLASASGKSQYQDTVQGGQAVKHHIDWPGRRLGQAAITWPQVIGVFRLERRIQRCLALLAGHVELTNSTGPAQFVSTCVPRWNPLGPQWSSTKFKWGIAMQLSFPSLSIPHRSTMSTPVLNSKPEEVFADEKASTEEHERVGYAPQQDLVIDPVVERSVIRRLDWRLLPMIWLCLVMSYIDSKSNADQVNMQGPTSEMQRSRVCTSTST